MTTGVQFTGTLAANASQQWFTWGWNPAWHVVWYMMPVTPKPGAPELSWTVSLERANATQVTYWLTVKNLTSSSITFEGRYAIMP
jgi:hypothetical protein